MVNQVPDGPTVPAGTRFSIVTPTHNRPDSLLRMLAALAVQDYPHELFEVVVVFDGDSGPGPAEVRADSYPFRLSVFQQPHAGPAAARNRALAAAGEPYVLFLDDDVVPCPSLVRRHAEAHDGARDRVVIGPLLATGSSPSAWTRWEWATLADQYRAMADGEWRPTPRQFYTGNASVLREHVAAVGGFNPEFRRGEDVELAWRLHMLGLQFVFEPRAEAEHLARRSFRAWLQAAREYGRTDVLLERNRTGGDLPGWVLREFPKRHPFTRRLAVQALKRPRLWRGVPAVGHLVASSASRLGFTQVANQACSALFTAAYWRGVAEQLGSPEAALRLIEPLEPNVGPARRESAS
jgi:GT2 family glycosyltransferase